MLWALAEQVVAAQIKKTHQTAVRDAPTFIEQHALFAGTAPSVYGR
jgi:hypothetical protein